MLSGGICPNHNCNLGLGKEVSLSPLAYRHILLNSLQFSWPWPHHVSLLIKGTQDFSDVKCNKNFSVLILN